MEAIHRRRGLVPFFLPETQNKLGRSEAKLRFTLEPFCSGRWFTNSSGWRRQSLVPASARSWAEDQSSLTGLRVVESLCASECTMSWTIHTFTSHAPRSPFFTYVPLVGHYQRPFRLTGAKLRPLFFSIVLESCLPPPTMTSPRRLPARETAAAPDPPPGGHL